MKTIAYVRATNIYDDSRATKQILSLAKGGYRVAVLGWDRDGHSEENCRQVFSEWSDRVCLSFFRQPMPNGIGMRNIDKLIGFMGWVFRTLGEVEHLCAIHACNLDAGIGAYRYARKHRIPLIYDIYDYYIDSHSIPGPARPLVEGLEISIINHAAATVICTDERREQIAKSRPVRVFVIHNSPDVPEIIPASTDYDYAYCGALGTRRLLSEILEEYPRHSHLKFLFAGYGDYVPQAQALQEQYENFRFAGPLPYAQVLDHQSRAAVIAAIYEPTIRNHRLCAPNKFYEAMALGKPLIVCRGTGIDRVVEQNDIGIVIDYDAGQFYQALTRLRENPALREQMGRRARALYEKTYTWTIMEQRLLELYSQILSA